MDDLKADVRDFWNEASCGERLLLDAEHKNGYRAQMAKRYSLEPYIEGFAGFDRARDLDVLEIGVGLGADHQRFAECGARLTGIDLTNRAVEHSQRRLDLFGLTSDLQLGDAEALIFADESFDVVYSWGVLHHGPDTPRAIDEVWRVLRRGGEARVMIYHKRAGRLHALAALRIARRQAVVQPQRYLRKSSRESGHEGLDGR